MGRLWQTVILSRWQPVMAFLPVEAIIKERQSTTTTIKSGRQAE